MAGFGAGNVGHNSGSVLFKLIEDARSSSLSLSMAVIEFPGLEWSKYHR